MITIFKFDKLLRTKILTFIFFGKQATLEILSIGFRLTSDLRH